MPCCCAMRRIQLSDLMLMRWLRTLGVFNHDLREQRAAIARAHAPAPRPRAGRLRYRPERRALSGSATTVGRPPSASSRIRASSGSSPSSVTPYSAARRAPPPAPKMCSAWPQLRAHMHAHVLDDAEHRHRDLLEHRQALAGIGQRDILRRGDDDRAGDRHALRERELDVAGARAACRPPGSRARPIRCRPAAASAPASPSARARPPPASGSTRKPIDIAVSPWALQRPDVLAVRASSGAARQAQHQRLARTVDVGIEDAHLRAAGRPGQRQVHRNGGFANSALAAGHRHDILHARERLEVALHGVGTMGLRELERQRHVEAGGRQVSLQRRLQGMRVAQPSESRAQCSPAPGRRRSSTARSAPACARVCRR